MGLWVLTIEQDLQRALAASMESQPSSGEAFHGAGVLHLQGSWTVLEQKLALLLGSKNSCGSFKGDIRPSKGDIDLDIGGPSKGSRGAPLKRSSFKEVWD